MRALRLLALIAIAAAAAATLAAAAPSAATAPAAPAAAATAPPAAAATAPPAAAAAHAAAGAALDPRTLPTVLKGWGRKMHADRIALRRSVALVRSGGILTALSLSYGQPLWSRDVGEGGCCGDSIMATDATVAVPTDDNLLLVNAADGAVRAQVDLGGGLSALAGPPLVALTGANELVAVDADSGQVTARTLLAEDVDDLMAEDGYVVLSMAGAGENQMSLAGYSADTLRELWRVATHDTAPQFERLGGRVHVARFAGRPEIVPVDPASGRFGQPLPAAREARIEPDWPPGIQCLLAAGAEDGRAPGRVAARPSAADSQPPARAPGERLRRVDLRSGSPLWTTELPCRVQAVARDQDALLASCDAGGGRGVLAVLAWSDGAVRQLAYGLPRGHAFAAAGDLVLVATADEVAVFSSRRFGPPEAGVSVEKEVQRILLDSRGDETPLERGPWIANRMRDLGPIGPAAYPFIARLLPKLGPTSLVAAADVLAAGAHRAAAPALAARLAAGQLEEPQAAAGWEGWNPQFALLRALAVLGGDAEVPPVAALLDAATGASPLASRRGAAAGALRREALATLVAMRSPAADRAVRAFLARPLPPYPGWSPPAPPAPPAVAPAPPAPPTAAASPGRRAAAPGAAAARAAAAAPAAAAANAASAAPAAAATFGAELPGGRRLVLFRNGFLGSPDDLWVAELDRQGRQSGPARFTGLRLPPDGDARPPQVRIVSGDPEGMVDTAGVGGGAAALRVELSNAAGRPLGGFLLAATAEDSDGDGLTDMVERRLRLDPANPDSDGDGLRDAVDPAPNARLPQPQTVEQEIAAAVFQQYFQFENGVPPEIAVVVSAFALEWRGRRQPTITLDSFEAARFLEETDGGGVPLVSIRPGEPPVTTPVAGDPPGAPPAVGHDEEVYTLVLDRSRLHALVFRVVLRNLNAAQPAAAPQWAISYLRLAWAG